MGFNITISMRSYLDPNLQIRCSQSFNELKHWRKSKFLTNLKYIPVNIINIYISFLLYMKVIKRQIVICKKC